MNHSSATAPRPSFPDACSHGVLWKDECEQCEKVWYEEVTKPLMKQLAERRHRWDRDGERCVVCGAKDWMGGECK